MELDDMKVAWAQLDQRVEAIHSIAQRQQDASLLTARRRPLWFLGAGQVVQVAVGLLVAVAGGSFWFDHHDTLHLLLAGASLHAYGVLLIVTGGVQLAMIRRAHETAPVLEFQARAARLRRARIISGLALGLPWWIMWVTVAMVAAQINGFDLYAHAPAWVWWNLAVGALGMLACWGIAHRLARKPLSSSKVRAVVDSLTGRNLRQVTQTLGEIDRFANE